MILAFCVRGSDESLPLDERFGRSDKFCIVNSDSGDYLKIIANPMKEATGSAGIGAVQLLSDQKVQGIIAPHLGPKAEEARRKLDIKLWDQGDCKTVDDAFGSWNNGDLKSVAASARPKGLFRA